MRHITEFRDPKAAQALVREIRETASQLPAVKIMEVCGGHTASIFRFGIRSLLPENIKLLSGPGCPVCVTDNGFIDSAIALASGQTGQAAQGSSGSARTKDVIIATFGDLIRVPGSESSLMNERAKGADIRICYSSLDALELARNNSDKEVVFLGIGFETTAPTVGAAIKRAKLEGISNFSVLSAMKTTPNAMKALASSGELALNAFICPGHVTAVTGSAIYEFLARDHHTACVVAGFEPLDLLQAILMITQQLKNNSARVENQYSRAITSAGNKAAQDLLKEVFTPSDVAWRGIGVIPASGLAVSEAYSAFDAYKRFGIIPKPGRENPGCICGSIMRGTKTPHDCKLFSKVCTPEDPKGSCMVSDEGSCATYYKYARQ